MSRTERFEPIQDDGPKPHDNGRHPSYHANEKVKSLSNATWLDAVIEVAGPAWDRQINNLRSQGHLIKEYEPLDRSIGAPKETIVYEDSQQ
jgi:hypothetical protein